MKRFFYIVSALTVLSLGCSGCSEKEDSILESSKSTPIKGIVLGMNEMGSTAGTNTRATVSGYSVNTASDPTSMNILTRGTGSTTPWSTTPWKLDFTLYNGFVSGGGVATTSYTDGSFTGGNYNSAGGYWEKDILAPQRYFPNYKNPYADLFLYPNAADTASLVKDQSTANIILAQDLLVKYKEKIKIAHEIITNASNQNIALNHKRSMLDFIISDIVSNDIDKVTVKVGTDEYTPYKVKQTDTSLEYLLILPESTQEDPIVQILTKSTPLSQPITYKQTITITSNGTKPLGGNRCYYLTLVGNQLELSPITVTDWTTGEPVSGEYVAVTAYPTFKGPANETYYLYYDNKLVDTVGNPKLQAITFSDKGECTIKPDGRIITHIGKENDFSKLTELTSPITLDKMYIDLSAIVLP